MKTQQEVQINLLNQIIEEAERQDIEFKRQMMTQHQANKTVGESWMVFHLKALRELISSQG